MQKSDDRPIIVDFYNAKNFGDDLLVYVLMQYFPNEDFVLKPGVRFMDRVIDKVTHMNNTRYVRASRRAKLWITIGGSIFQDAPGSEIYFDKELKKYETIACPYALLNVNYGPERTKQFQNKVRKIVRGAEIVSVRDKKTYDLFKKFNEKTSLDADLAFSMKVPETRKTYKKTALISIIGPKKSWDEDKIQCYRDIIAKLIEKNIEAGYTPILFSACTPEGDADEVKYHMGKSYAKDCQEYIYDGDIKRALRLFGKADLVCGTRLHSVIVAIAYGKKVLPILYDAKISLAMKEVGIKNYDSISIDEAGKKHAEKIVVSKITKLKPSSDITCSMSLVSKFLS